MSLPEPVLAVASVSSTTGSLKVMSLLLDEMLLSSVILAPLVVNVTGAANVWAVLISIAPVLVVSPMVSDPAVI